MLKVLVFYTLMLCCMASLAQNSVQSVVADSSISRQGMIISKEKSRITLSWYSSDSLIGGFYSIERKTNEKDFEVVGVIRMDSAFGKYDWVDEAATIGRNAYRVYAVNTTGERNLIATGLAVVQGDEAIRFYPNPVDNVLIIRTGFAVDAMILDAQGTVRIPAFKVNGLYTLNVSALEPGIYFLRFINKITNLVTQERLVKK